MKKIGFTMTEFLVVIAIILVLAALLFPVLSRAKESAHRSSCESNLRQVYLSLELYREEWNGGEVGTAAQMGLPLYIIPATQTIACSANPLPENWPYIQLWQGYVVSDPSHIWQNSVAKHQGGTALVVDPNHNPPGIPEFSPYFKRFGLVLFLDGSIRKVNRAGDLQSPETWALRQGEE